MVSTLYMFKVARGIFQRPLFCMSAETLAVLAQGFPGVGNIFPYRLHGNRVFWVFTTFPPCPDMSVLTNLSPHHKMLLSALVRFYLGSFPVSNIEMWASHFSASCLVFLSASKLPCRRDHDPIRLRWICFSIWLGCVRYSSEHCLCPMLFGFSIQHLIGTGATGGTTQALSLVSTSQNPKLYITFFSGCL